MKTIILNLLLLLPVAAICQDTATAKKGLSKLEAIQARAGSVIKKEVISIGKFQGVTIEAMKVTDVSTEKVIKGIRLSMYSGSAFTAGGQYTAFVDEAEVEALIKFLNYVKGFTETTENYTEYVLITEGDLKAYSYTGNKKWVYGLQLDKYRSGSAVTFNLKDVDDLLAYLDMAKGKL